MIGGSIYYLHEDALGSVRMEDTASVVVKFSSNYVPYGSSFGATGKEVFMYTGRQYDPSTGLYYLMARFYDPSIGRFVTEDSYSGSEDDPMTLDRYTYARDNPERYVDPSGHRYAYTTGGQTSSSATYTYSSTSISSVVSGGSSTYTKITTTTTITCTSGSCTVSTYTGYTTWTITAIPWGTDSGGATEPGGQLSSVALAGQIGMNSPSPACYADGFRLGDPLSQALQGQPLAEVVIGGEMFSDGAGEVTLGAGVAVASSPIPGLDVVGAIGGFVLIGDGLANMVWGGILIGEGGSDFLRCGYLGH
jgi:RHS repeat-associated protein